MFYGVSVSLYFLDNKRHKKPHIHAQYQEHEAVVSIPDGKVLEGRLPPAKMRLLLADWEVAASGQQPYKIEPLR
jgi:hypothetical protein